MYPPTKSSTTEPVRTAAFESSRRRLLQLALTTAIGAAGRRLAAAPQQHVMLSVASDGDLLAFKPDQLYCPAGAAVHLTFIHTGKYISQDHNWVLTVPGAADAVAEAALKAGEESGWLPRNERRILAATPLCAKGQQVTVDFTAPSPGDYPFLCTNPGHGAVMHGVLHVTAK
jgi:azurin